MTDDMANLVLEHLRYIRNRVDGVETAVQQLTLRFGALEGHLAGVHVSEAAQNSELDRVKQRIERRLELHVGEV